MRLNALTGIDGFQRACSLLQRRRGINSLNALTGIDGFQSLTPPRADLEPNRRLNALTGIDGFQRTNMMTIHPVRGIVLMP